MELVFIAAIPCVIVYLYVRRNRERARNAPLRTEIEARVCFETPLSRASVLGTGGFGGTRGMWISVRGPKRLIVGTDAFMVSAPQALCASMCSRDVSRPLHSVRRRRALLIGTG